MHYKNFLALFLISILTVIFTSCSCGHRLVPTEEPPPLPCFFVPEKIRVALVLGSGGVRGMAHVGVLEVLEEEGIPIDLIIGCSAGSIVGALYADNPCISEVKRAVGSIKSTSMLDFNIWQCRYGLCQGRSLLKVIDQDIEAKTFDELKIPLVVVASDLNSGELVVMGEGSIESAVVASCSIPFMFVPKEHYGRILVDGGVVNPVPVKLARDLGADIVIAVDLCELLPRTFPTNLFEVATRSAEIAFMWQNEACCQHANVVLRPKTCDVGAFNDDLRDEIYEAGKKAASENIEEIKCLIGQIQEDHWRCNGWRVFNPQCYKPDIYHNQQKKSEQNNETQ